ncbi:MAG: hypothetical protein AAGJ82_15025 [Bacteroidota bacterium]
MSPFRLLFIAFFLASIPLAAQQISGIFRPTEAKMEYIEKVDWNSFTQQHREFQQKGYRLTSVQSTGIGKDRRYWGILTESTLADTLALLNSWPEMVKAKRAMAARGWLLTTVQAYALGETDARYIAVWHRNPDDLPHKIWKLDTPESLDKKTEEMAQQQFYIQGIETFTTPSGVATYLAIYHYDPLPVRNYVATSTSQADFNTNYNLRIRSKVRVTDLEFFQAKEARYWLAVYQPGTYDDRVILNLPQADFYGKWDELEQANFQLINWEIRD